jgi:ADP-heptose:LPS heptosyltransferase
VILVLRALGLGDLLTAAPALRALRRARPHAELALAAPAALAPLVDRIGAVDRLVDVPAAVTAPPVALDWAGPAPDLAVNLHGRGPESTRLLTGLGPRRLWSYGLSDGPQWRDDEHEVTRWRRLVEAYGCETRTGDLFVGPPGHRDGPALVHPGAARPARRWPPERFADVVRGLAARRVPVRVTAGPGEEELAARVAAMAGRPDAVAAGLDLGQLADLVRASRLLVCGDTGVAHLATAYRTPLVVLFGPVSPRRWGPVQGGPHRVLWRPGSDDDDAVPADGPHPALLRVTTDDVLAAADDLLSA